MTKSRQKKKKKLKVKRLVIFFAILLFIILLIYQIFNTNIKNIYVKGNINLSDQEVIDIAKISNYPNSLSNGSYTIEKRLEKSKYIESAKVSKTNLFKTVYIEIQENYPLFFYQVENKTILYDGKKENNNIATTTVINQIPDTIYKKFFDNMQKIDINVLNRMSQIEYKPNSVDSERFLILMNDGNYVYLTLKKFNSINKYMDMIKSFENKKGILHLDSGEYFEEFK